MYLLDNSFLTSVTGKRFTYLKLNLLDHEVYLKISRGSDQNSNIVQSRIKNAELYAGQIEVELLADSRIKIARGLESLNIGLCDAFTLTSALRFPLAHGRFMPMPEDVSEYLNSRAGHVLQMYPHNECVIVRVGDSPFDCVIYPTSSSGCESRSRVTMSVREDEVTLTAKVRAESQTLTLSLQEQFTLAAFISVLLNSKQYNISP